jgi:DNA replicative helicase MCM subunit Mcm2 (Cdc46/Mcm family)
MKPTIFV